MADMYWIGGFIAVWLLIYLVHRCNGNRGHSRLSKELARENSHLRHVVAELSMEKHWPPEHR